MYCPHCGNKLDEGARFCGSCGAAVQDTNSQAPTVETMHKVQAKPDSNAKTNSTAVFALRQGNANADGGEEIGGSTLKEAVDSGRRSSHRKLSPFVIVVLALALAAGTAFAAHYVYKNVVLPQQQATQQEQAAEEPGADSSAAEEPVDFAEANDRVQNLNGTIYTTLHVANQSPNVMPILQDEPQVGTFRIINDSVYFLEQTGVHEGTVQPYQERATDGSFSLYSEPLSGGEATLVASGTGMDFWFSDHYLCYSEGSGTDAQTVVLNLEDKSRWVCPVAGTLEGCIDGHIYIRSNDQSELYKVSLWDGTRETVLSGLQPELESSTNESADSVTITGNMIVVEHGDNLQGSSAEMRVNFTCYSPNGETLFTHDASNRIQSYFSDAATNEVIFSLIEYDATFEVIDTNGRTISDVSGIGGNGVPYCADQSTFYYAFPESYSRTTQEYTYALYGYDLASNQQVKLADLPELQMRY